MQDVRPETRRTPGRAAAHEKSETFEVADCFQREVPARVATARCEKLADSPVPERRPTNPREMVESILRSICVPSTVVVIVEPAVVMANVCALPGVSETPSGASETVPRTRSTPFAWTRAISRSPLEANCQK